MTLTNGETYVHLSSSRIWWLHWFDFLFIEKSRSVDIQIKTKNLRLVLVLYFYCRYGEYAW